METEPLVRGFADYQWEFSMAILNIQMVVHCSGNSNNDTFLLYSPSLGGLPLVNHSQHQVIQVSGCKACALRPSIKDIALFHLAAFAAVAIAKFQRSTWASGPKRGTL